jgi:phi LC3 family holin
MKTKRKFINWKVRFLNPAFLGTFIPQSLLVLQVLLALINMVYPIGFTLTDDMINGFMGKVNLIFLILGWGGNVLDPTVLGLKDSPKVRNREEPIDPEDPKYF